MTALNGTRATDVLGFESPFAAGEDPEAASAMAAFGAFEDETFEPAYTAVPRPYGETGVGAGPDGRLVIARHPLLRGHRGTSPDLVLKWHAVQGPGAVDVVVHFHGYSGHRHAMRIDRHKEALSGLDFAVPGLPARTLPTLAILPRGNYFGGKSGSGYNFPALVKSGALDALIQDALTRASQATGHALQQGRLIVTGHSGGGAPINAILAHADPDEVHIFDGTYGASPNLRSWARRRIARELASPTARPPALRILYRPGTPTATHAQSIAGNLCDALADGAGERLRPRFRADGTAVSHNEIPVRFGGRLLADAAADLPDVKTRACAPAKRREADAEEFQASPYWQDPPTSREAAQYEGISASESGYLESDEAPQDERRSDAYGFASSEALAWLDTSAEDTEHEWLQTESDEAMAYPYAESGEEPAALADAWHEAEPEVEQGIAAFEGDAGMEAERYYDGFDEAFEPPAEAYALEDEQYASGLAALESLLEAEAGADAGLADRIKGIAAFVLGPTLQRGSRGSGVETLQRALNVLGNALGVDGDFGPATDRAVRAFQSRAGLTPDGVVEPRTKAAIAAAVGKSPLPAPAPRPGPLASGLGEAIARIAEEEYRRWHAPAKLQETHAAAVPILQQYYREGVNRGVTAAELQSKPWQQQHPWSAVFVSFVMRKAGAGTAFRYSAAHQGYIAAARRNRLQGDQSNPYWAYRVGEVAPQVGDLVCALRNNSGATYDNIGDAQTRATHCDIVTEVRPGSLRVIGGNVNQNVDAKTIRTLADGKLALDGNQSRFFAVLRCRGQSGAAVQPGPAPMPGPIPANRQMAPAEFVAAHGPAARASQAANGVPALVTLGQAALESGWGKHAPRFNFFGIKAKASDPEPTRQLLQTREVLAHRNGRFPEVISITPRPDGRFDYVVRDWFRAYPDAATAFNAHGEFLVRNKRYSRAFQVAHDPYAFAAEVARAGYATDPSYERVLASVMKRIES